ncbi:unnamed protein product [Brassica rapa subsp. narinosa]
MNHEAVFKFNTKATYFPWSRLLGHKHHQQPPTLFTCKAVKKFNHRITKPLLR